MKNTGLLLLCCAALLLFACQSGSPEQTYDFPHIPVSYPDTPRDTARSNDFSGYKVTAPYQWLEQPDSAQTKAWTAAQSKMARSYLDQLPGREVLSQEISQLSDYSVISPPQLINGAYYYIKSERGVCKGLFRRDSLNAQEAQLINPESLGWPTSADITSLRPSPDGALLALKRSVAHSEWEDILLFDLQQEKFLSDTLQFVRHSNITWYGSGFFYSRYARPGSATEPYLFQQVYYHRPGTDQSEDELIYADWRDPRFRFEVHLSTAQDYLVLLVSDTDGHLAVYGRPARKTDAAFTTIAEGLEYQLEWAGADASGFYLITNLDAPNRRLVRVDPDLPALNYWETILPESSSPLSSVHWADGNLLAVYQGETGSAMALYSTKGKLLKRPKLPENGFVMDISSRYDDPNAFISYGNILEPPQVYHLDLEAERMNAFHTPVTILKPGNFETRLVQLESYDGTPINMYVVHTRELKLNGQHPALIFAGGRQTGPFAPMYDAQERLMAQLMLRQGGICAIPALRGGSALNTKLRRAGQREYKQNTFDDFQAAAEYLIANQYTSANRLGVYGEGHGGLIASASLAQRPDLFGAVASVDGLYDLLQYPEFGSGWKWLPEFGAPDDPKQFDPIFAYSPVHKISADRYPATILTAHLNSDVVMPVHTWKMGAALQYQQTGKAPALIYPVRQAQAFDETAADIMAFLLYHLKTPVQE
jgi:prolyl oligopeptidase